MGRLWGGRRSAGGGGSFLLGFGLEVRGLVSWFFYFLFCFCGVVNCSVMAGWYMTVVASVSLVVTSPWRMLCFYGKTISKVRFQVSGLGISLKKKECFGFNHSLESLPYFIHQNRLLGQVYHFSLLICYPYLLITGIIKNIFCSNMYLHAIIQIKKQWKINDHATSVT